jgi:hypothetical protein
MGGICGDGGWERVWWLGLEEGLGFKITSGFPKWLAIWDSCWIDRGVGIGHGVRVNELRK